MTRASTTNRPRPLPERAGQRSALACRRLRWRNSRCVGSLRHWRCGRRAHRVIPGVAGRHTRHEPDQRRNETSIGAFAARQRPHGPRGHPKPCAPARGRMLASPAWAQAPGSSRKQGSVVIVPAAGARVRPRPKRPPHVRRQSAPGRCNRADRASTRGLPRLATAHGTVLRNRSCGPHGASEE